MLHAYLDIYIYIYILKKEILFSGAKRVWGCVTFHLIEATKVVLIRAFTWGGA